MKEKILLLSAVVFSLIVISFISLASAKHSATKYEYQIGTGFANGPVVTMAPNGDKIEIIGNGTFVFETKSITGNGTFVYKDRNGNIITNGTWIAKSLLYFDSWGAGKKQNITKEFEGGRAMFLVHSTPYSGGSGFDAIMVIESLLGKYPKNANEGIELRVKLEPGKSLNFLKRVGGETLFFRK